MDDGGLGLRPRSPPVNVRRAASQRDRGYRILRASVVAELICWLRVVIYLALHIARQTYIQPLINVIITPFASSGDSCAEFLLKSLNLYFLPLLFNSSDKCEVK